MDETGVGLLLLLLLLLLFFTPTTAPCPPDFESPSFLREYAQYVQAITFL